MRHLVRDERVVIHMLMLIGNDTTIAVAFRPLAREGEVELVTGDAVVQGDDVVVDPTVGLLVDIYITHAHVLGVRLLHAVEIQRCVLTHVGLDDLRSQEVAVVGGMVAEEHFQLSPFLQDDQYTTVHHEVWSVECGVWSVGGFQDVDDLYGPFNHHAFGHIDIQSVLCQHGIQIRHRIMILGSQLMVIRGGGKVLQGADDNSFGQMTLRQGLGIEHIVHHEIQRGTQVRHVAAEGIVGVDGYVEPIEVQSVVGCEELVDVGIFIALHLSGREAAGRELPECLLAHGIHHGTAVPANQLARLLIEQRKTHPLPLPQREGSRYRCCFLLRHNSRYFIC